jgi:hypothetical protein
MGCCSHRHRARQGRSRQRARAHCSGHVTSARIANGPSARLPGYELPVFASNRVTSPPSSSMAMTSCGRSAWARVQGGELIGVFDIPAVEHDAAKARGGPSHPIRWTGREAGRNSAGEPVDRSSLDRPAVSHRPGSAAR